MTSAQLSAAFFLQMFVILAICRFVGMIARRLGQPQVVGEMIAGVIMGPSLFGLLFPSWQQVIFPKDSLKLLYVLAQFGVGLYMFLVGTEFKTDLFPFPSTQRSFCLRGRDASAFRSGWPFGALAVESSRTLLRESDSIRSGIIFGGCYVHHGIPDVGSHYL